jgi:FkbM family methyltransferase
MNSNLNSAIEKSTNFFGKIKFSMKIYLNAIFGRWKFYLILSFLGVASTSVAYYFNSISRVVSELNLNEIITVVYENTSVSYQMDIIDLQENPKENFICIKTKYLLHIVRTTICVHGPRDVVSRSLLKDRIWEEQHLIQLFGFLIRYPQISLIDVGANLGTYTMFAASLGRFVLAIECFKPNIDRILKAVQIEKVQDRVVLIGNAIFSESGKYLKIESDLDNIGGQAIIANSTVKDSNNDVYTVKTMRFDDILPILKQKNIRNAVMKVDIQWSEAFLCETGGKTFDYVNLPVVLMEWVVIGRYDDRMHKVLKFFVRRGYIATTNMCEVLDEKDAFRSWPNDIYWMKMDRSEIC